METVNISLQQEGHQSTSLTSYSLKTVSDQRAKCVQMFRPLKKCVKGNVLCTNQDTGWTLTEQKKNFRGLMRLWERSVCTSCTVLPGK